MNLDTVVCMHNSAGQLTNRPNSRIFSSLLLAEIEQVTVDQVVR